MSPASPTLIAAWNEASQRAGFVGTANVWSEAAGDEPRPIYELGGIVVTNVETNHWFHTSGDTPETVSPESLSRSLHFFQEFIEQVKDKTVDELRQ